MESTFMCIKSFSKSGKASFENWNKYVCYFLVAKTYVRHFSDSEKNVRLFSPLWADSTAGKTHYMWKKKSQRPWCAVGGVWCRACTVGFLRDSVDSLSTLALESSHPASGEHLLSLVRAACPKWTSLPRSWVQPMRVTLLSQLWDTAGLDLEKRQEQQGLG